MNTVQWIRKELETLRLRAIKLKEMAPLRILLLEDEEADIALFLRAVAAVSPECRCDVSKTEENAREMVDHSDYAVIFVDLLLPNGESGLSFLDYLKTRGLSRRVILATGVLDPGLLRQALAFGAVPFLLKPITADKLRPIIT